MVEPMRRIGVRRLYLGMGPAESPAATTMRAFDAFVRDDGERLRRVLAAQHGPDLGNDLTSDAIAFAWEHWDRVGAMANRSGTCIASPRHRPVEGFGRTVRRSGLN